MGASDNQEDSAPGHFGYDAIVIGTGFGGAVTAARLTEAGARVLILERGMRYSGEAFPALPKPGQVVGDMARYVWNSDEGRLGLWDVRDLDATHAAQAAGYGGGSLIYAGVHLRAPSEVLASWPQTASHPYTREALDPYYDLAAHMLDVNTIESAARTLYPLRKTSALRAAAAELGRSEQTFFTPLAVRFKPGHDLHGREQPACVGCGECNSGCRYGAKNTLDQNYLALAERARKDPQTPRTGFSCGAALKDGEPLAVVRTLAEARSIKHCKLAGAEGFEVGFLDHSALDQRRASSHRLDVITGPRTEHATARYVFVCAGAVGSTELLMRNQDRDHLDLPNEQLGQSYFGNSDALGIVRQATHAQQPHVGPVITTALVHRGAAASDPWLMIQDGGYGAAVHALVEAVFASPVLAQRNRFYESAKRVAPAHLTEGPSFATPYVDPAVPVRRNASLAEGLGRVEMAHELKAIIPPQLTQAGKTAIQRAEAFVSNDVEKTIDALVAVVVDGGAHRIASALAKGNPAFPYLERALRAVLGVAAKAMRMMTAFGARGALQRYRSEPLDAFVRERAIGVATMLVMKERFKLNDQRVAFVEGLKLLTRYASDPASYAESLEHTAVLLTMGRDRQRHRLYMTKKRGLQALLDGKRPGRGRLYSEQERLMRELASVLGGELRLNPAWSQAHTPITVHGQGGCIMAVNAADGVTDPYGEVHGCKGLFVMDAALFPSPVGVNPTATILAVAERNIEAFIRKQPGLETFEAAQAKAARSISETRRAMLTPRAIDSTAKSPEIETKALGIRFEERMYGFHTSTRNARTDQELKLNGRPNTQRLYTEHEACYIDGRIAGDALQLVLQVDITDLPAFMADRLHRATLAGTLQLMSQTPDNDNLHPRLRELLTAAGGSLEVERGEVELLPRIREDERVFRYLLTFESPLPGGKGLVLQGHKRVRDEPGQDEWQDTTALFFWLAEIEGYDEASRPIASQEALSHGIVRVSLDEFLYKQLRSIEVVNVGDAPGTPGVPDPANVLWAAATFGKFFLGNLADVYLKEAALVTRVVKRSLSLDGDER